MFCICVLYVMYVSCILCYVMLCYVVLCCVMYVCMYVWYVWFVCMVCMYVMKCNEIKCNVM